MIPLPVPPYEGNRVQTEQELFPLKGEGLTRCKAQQMRELRFKSGSRPSIRGLKVSLMMDFIPAPSGSLCRKRTRGLFLVVVAAVIGRSWQSVLLDPVEDGADDGIAPDLRNSLLNERKGGRTGTNDKDYGLDDS